MFSFTHTYRDLPELLWQEANPLPAPRPTLIHFNSSLAASLGLDAQAHAPDAWAAALAGRALPAGSQPLAMAYAGHQFGQFSPQLGDGRALLVGEVIDRNGKRRDLHLKGSGRTPCKRFNPSLYFS